MVVRSSATSSLPLSVTAEWEREVSRSRPEPGVGPSSRLLEPADSGRSDTDEEESDEVEGGTGGWPEEGLVVVALPPARFQTMIWLS